MVGPLLDDYGTGSLEVAKQIPLHYLVVQRDKSLGRKGQGSLRTFRRIGGGAMELGNSQPKCEPSHRDA